MPAPRAAEPLPRDGLIAQRPLPFVLDQGFAVRAFGSCKSNSTIASLGLNESSACRADDTRFIKVHDAEDESSYGN